MSDKIDELESAYKAAAKGNWRSTGSTVATGTLTHVGNMCNTPTARFIVLAHSHLPSLIEEVQRLRDAVRWRDLDKDEKPADNQEVQVFGDGLKAIQRGRYNPILDRFLGRDWAGCNPRLWLPLPALPEGKL